MTTKTYVAYLEPASDGYGVSFPDLPGCVSHGRDLDDAAAQAKDALSLHLEGMAEDGEKIPDATSAHDLVGDMTRPGNIVLAMITVEAPDESDRVNVYLPKSLLERVDAYVAANAPINRSTFFGAAARLLLARSPALSQLAGDFRPLSRDGVIGQADANGDVMLGPTVAWDPGQELEVALDRMRAEAQRILEQASRSQEARSKRPLADMARKRS